MRLERVIHDDNLGVIVNCDEKDYVIIAHRTIEEYNLIKVNKEKIEQCMNKINTNKNIKLCIN